MGNVIAFVGVVGLIVVVPGPDMALVLRNGIGKGRRGCSSVDEQATPRLPIKPSKIDRKMQSRKRGVRD